VLVETDPIGPERINTTRRDPSKGASAGSSVVVVVVVVLETVVPGAGQLIGVGIVTVRSMVTGVVIVRSIVVTWALAALTPSAAILKLIAVNNTRRIIVFVLPFYLLCMLTALTRGCSLCRLPAKRLPLVRCGLRICFRHLKSTELKQPERHNAVKVKEKMQRRLSVKWWQICHHLLPVDFLKSQVQGGSHDGSAGTKVA